MVTNLIKNYLRDVGISQAVLARRMQESPQNLNIKLSRNTLDTGYLHRICIALKHDFFATLSKSVATELKGDTTQLPEEATLYNIITQSEYIESLRENVKLHRENKELLQQLTALQRKK